MQDGSVRLPLEYRHGFENDFKTGILDSELLSRGWVYQEVLLTPANLFCTKQQLWWSCSDVTCSENWPEYMPQNPNVLEIGEQHWAYKDDIRERKLLITDTKNDLSWWYWGRVLTEYGRTKVTKPDDRVVALTGIFSVLRSLAPELKNSVYHSGVWLGSHILEQLLWGLDPHCRAPLGRVDTARYPIPSWSPLSCKTPYYEDVLGLPGLPLPPPGDVSIKNEGLDALGRATSLEGCAMHLRGILVPIQINNHDFQRGTSSAYPYSRDDMKADLQWDNTKVFEDVQLAMEEKGEGEGQGSCCLQALIVSLQATSFHGLALRPCENGLRQIDGRRVWSRCGYVAGVMGGKSPETKMEYIKAWRFGEYGFTWSCKRLEKEPWSFYWRSKSSGVTPQLEDICIV